MNSKAHRNNGVNACATVYAYIERAKAQHAPANHTFFCERLQRQTKSVPAMILVSNGPEASTPSREKVTCHGDNVITRTANRAVRCPNMSFVSR